MCISQVKQGLLMTQVCSFVGDDHVGIDRSLKKRSICSCPKFHEF